MEKQGAADSGDEGDDKKEPSPAKLFVDRDAGVSKRAHRAAGSQLGPDGEGPAGGF